MRFKMVSLITGMALVCVAGSVLATTSIYVSHGGSIDKWSQAGVSQGGVGMGGYSISKATAPLDNSVNGYGPTLNGTQNNSTPRVWYFNYGASLGYGQSYREWAIANDPTTGLLYSFRDGAGNGGYLSRWTASTVEWNTKTSSAMTYQGYSGTAGDIEICGSNVYFTIGSGNSDRNEVFFLDKNFTEGTAASVFVTVAGTNNLGGLAFDGAGNLYVVRGNSDVVKYSSGGVLDNTFSISGVGELRDIDWIEGELFLSTNSGVKVFSTAGVATGVVLASGQNSFYTAPDVVQTVPVPEPSSIFGLLVGGSSLIGLLRRRAR